MAKIDGVQEVSISELVPYAKMRRYTEQNKWI